MERRQPQLPPCTTDIFLHPHPVMRAAARPLHPLQSRHYPPSLVCLLPSRHLAPAVCVVDRGQEVPQLRLPGRDDGPVAVPEERLRAGRVHQHLRRRPGDRVGLCRCRQAPQPVLSSAASPRHCQQKDSASPKGTPASLTPLPHRLGKHRSVAGLLPPAPWDSSLLSPRKVPADPI